LKLGVLIRIFNFTQDFDSVLALWKTAGPGLHVRRSDKPEEILKKLQRDPDLFLVAELDGKIIGSVMGGFDGRRGMVYHLAVEAIHRNLGIGSSLMHELELRLKEKGCIRAYLLVTRDNTSAMHFYEEMGWEQMDIYPYGKDLA
jgi:ribosomal protein S18 acetylase RimI-like enzyme